MLGGAQPRPFFRLHALKNTLEKKKEEEQETHCMNFLGCLAHSYVFNKQLEDTVSRDRPSCNIYGVLQWS